jgi:hypothetical protein
MTRLVMVSRTLVGDSYHKTPMSPPAQKATRERRSSPLQPSREAYVQRGKGGDTWTGRHSMSWTGCARRLRKPSMASDQRPATASRWQPGGRSRPSAGNSTRCCQPPSGTPSPEQTAIGRRRAGPVGTRSREPAGLLGVWRLVGAVRVCRGRRLAGGGQLLVPAPTP